MIRKYAAVVLIGIAVCLVLQTTVNAVDITHTLYFNESDVIIDTVEIEGHTYIDIRLDSNIPMSYQKDTFYDIDSIGLPRLPCRNVNFVIPYNHEVVQVSEVLSCVGVMYTCEEDVYVYPSQHPTPTMDGYDFEPFQHVDEIVYQTMPYYPNDTDIVKLVNPQGVLENLAIATVSVSPIIYFPTTGEITLLSSVTYTMETQPSGNPSSLSRTSTVWPAYIDYPETAIKEQLVENPEMIEQFAGEFEILPMGGNRQWIYELIVIPDSSFIGPADQLRLWRTDTHRPAKVLTLGEIESFYDDCDLPEKIRRTFRHYYENYGAKALLLADDETVRYLYDRNSSVPKDTIFMHIGNSLYLGEFTRDYEEWDYDGDGIFGEPSDDRPDYFNEGLVGIVPADSPEDLQTYVNKVIQYEKSGYSGNLLYYTTCIDHMRSFNQQEFYPEYIPAHITIDNYYGIEMPGGNSEFPLTPFGQHIEDYYKFNNPIYVNESSHGSPHHNTGKTTYYNLAPKSYMSSVPNDDPWGGMNPGYIYDLENSGNLMTMWTLSCYVGGYDADRWFADVVSMAEAYLFVPYGGCIIYNGHSRWGWTVSSKFMTRDYWGTVFNTLPDQDSPSGYIAGFALRDTRTRYLNYRDENYTMNLFGDPAVAIFTDVPGQFTIDGPDTVRIGEVTFDYFVSDNQGYPDGGAYACIRQNERFELGYVGPEGLIVGNDSWPIRWDILSCDDIYITISAWADNDHNYLAEQKVVTVVSDNISEITHNYHKDFIDDSRLPQYFELGNNYPNPFNSQTNIKLALPRDCHTSIEVFNLMGNKVATIIDGELNAGYHDITFDGKNSTGDNLASGVYFYHLRTGEFAEVKKMVLLR
ncbi:MAG: T9SS type A sorting domain-containing protein [candidate division Zixibacteria bacterium]|nr:T9SS type A sorting domain-containing protein [candidate division Zixibacteria bacterium]